jgi:hypothetical protein
MLGQERVACNRIRLRKQGLCRHEGNSTAAMMRFPQGQRRIVPEQSPLSWSGAS